MLRYTHPVMFRGSVMPITALIDSIRAAAIAPEHWDEVLDGLCRITGSASATIWVCDGVHPPRWRTTRRSRTVLEAMAKADVWIFPERCPERLFEACIGDRQVHWIEKLGPLRRLTHDVIERAYREAGLGWQMGTVIPLPCQDVIVLTLERQLTDGPHDLARLAHVKALMPHLEDAGRIACRLGLERATGALETLDTLGIPAVLLDRTGRQRGAMAKDGLGPGFGTSEQEKRFRLGDADGDALLARILAGCSPPGAIAFAPSGDAPGRMAYVFPLARHPDDIFHDGYALVMFSRSGSMARRIDAGALCIVLGLSAAESRLVCALAEGISLSAAAKQCGIRSSTARAYLERIFHKTGCRRQSELLYLVAELMQVVPVQADPASAASALSGRHE